MLTKNMPMTYRGAMKISKMATLKDQRGEDCLLEICMWHLGWSNFSKSFVLCHITLMSHKITIEFVLYLCIKKIYFVYI